ncbi:MAG: MarR family winged helix-turn-helix transcriptional regulator [Acidiferrobacterales bacterium]
MQQDSVGATFLILNELLASRLSKRIGNHLSVHGLSLAEYLIMHHLNSSPVKAMPRIELAEYIGMSASGITRLLAPMEKNKIVEKEANPRDARQSLVKLSKTGQRLFKEASTTFNHVADSLAGKLSRNQLEKCIELYGKLM